MHTGEHEPQHREVASAVDIAHPADHGEARGPQGPGTGKSHVCTLLQERLGPLRLLALDAAKEEFYTREGFPDAAAKEHLDRAALELFLARVRTAMAEGGPLLAEYPLSEKQRPALAAACNTHGYRPITVRLVAEFEELFARQHRRDLDPSRHLDHLVDAYRPGDILTTAAGRLRC